jgi:DNA topoisomerase-3
MRFREGCSFVIWKLQEGKAITAAMAKSLATSGETRKVSLKLEDGSVVPGKWKLVDHTKGTIEYIRIE